MCTCSTLRPLQARYLNLYIAGIHTSYSNPYRNDTFHLKLGGPFLFST